MRFRTNIASHAMPEAKQDICASRRSTPLIVEGQDDEGINSRHAREQ
ncbi:hypothetical protein CSIRO_1826 [Bradyrhizobiaceae bacterium SG-6C]|nr:hypothetical protein CSIRO_1826 [Bradyrhizobiaceae bacterium SG-6C]